MVSWDVLEDEVVIGFAISQQVTLEGGLEHIKIEVVDRGGRGAERERKKERGAREMGRKLHTWLGREPQTGILWLESGN